MLCFIFLENEYFQLSPLLKNNRLRNHFQIISVGRMTTLLETLSVSERLIETHICSTSKAILFNLVASSKDLSCVAPKNCKTSVFTNARVTRTDSPNDNDQQCVSEAEFHKSWSNTRWCTDVRSLWDVDGASWRIRKPIWAVIPWGRRHDRHLSSLAKTPRTSKRRDELMWSTWIRKKTCVSVLLYFWLVVSSFPIVFPTNHSHPLHIRRCWCLAK